MMDEANVDIPESIRCWTRFWTGVENEPEANDFAQTGENTYYRNPKAFTISGGYSALNHWKKANHLERKTRKDD